MRGPYHILAKPEQIAEKVIAVGDPARVEHISSLLKGAELVNTNRGFPVYTGEFDGMVVTVACHGIGGPSSSIVFEELRMLGAEIIVRLGTAGAFLEEMEPGELLIPDSASCSSTYGSLSTYAPGAHLPLAPNYEVLEAIVQEARRAGARFRIGAVISNDAFYAEDPHFVEKWRGYGVIAVEMECAALFGLARLRGFKSAAVLVISNNLVKDTPMLLAHQLKDRVMEAAKIILNAFKKL